MFEEHLNDRQPHVDWLLWIAVLSLMVIGIAFIYSATSVHETVGLWQRFREMELTEFLGWLADEQFFRQAVFYGLGLCAAATVCLIDYHRLARWSLVFYWIGILFLVLVMVPQLGTEVYGARRWINLGFFRFQPSEFAKVCVVLVLAHFLSRPLEELRQPRVFFQALAMTLLPFTLILLEPDLGSALVLLPLTLVMMFAAQVPGVFLKRLLCVSGLLVTVLLVDILFAPPGLRVPLEDYQRDRLLVYFGQEFASRNATPAEREKARRRQDQKSHNVRHALISVGSGGLVGKGWCEGSQKQLGYLPNTVAHNDFIFSVIAEERGFLGSLMVLSLYTVILFSGIRIAGQARDRLGKVLAVGVVTMLFSHVFINIGMNIALVPVTGIPLPLLSYGGTSVLCSLIAAGILQNIHIYRRSY
jgi:rod shape determining protein RodA